MRNRFIVAAAGLTALSWLPSLAMAEEAVVGGMGNDYQAAIAVPWDAPADRLVVFERLNASFLGDLWVTRSQDGGETWSGPAPVVATAANERHATLVQVGIDEYALFHLSGAGASSSYRIHRGTSADGMDYVPQGALDLGWPTGGEANPHVIRATDGMLTMTYQRLGGAAYVARSDDNGATWDTLMTQVSPGNAALPRIAYRESDGIYLLAYQTGSNPVTVWTKTSTNPYDWSTPAQPLVPDGNNHDAYPMVMPDDSFVVFWARVANGHFQVFSRRSRDGAAWEAPVQHTNRPGLANIQPHALTTAQAHLAELYWGAAQAAGDSDYDIVRESGVVVADGIFAHDFEAEPESPGLTIPLSAE